MLTKADIQIRDPFVLPIEESGLYYLYGSTDKDIWKGKATGFDVYRSKDLENWEGPFPAFRPPADFWSDTNYWAPEVHIYKGRYYMFATFKAEGVCRGTQILVADDPLGLSFLTATVRSRPVIGNAWTAPFMWTRKVSHG